MGNHRGRSRERRDVGLKDLKVALGGHQKPSAEIVSQSVQIAPNVAKPKSWTPEFCRAQATHADAKEEWGAARDWRVRAHVIEHYHVVRGGKPNQPHPYREMSVDESGREISELVITSQLREELLGAMENGAESLPRTE